MPTNARRRIFTRPLLALALALPLAGCGELGDELGELQVVEPVSYTGCPPDKAAYWDNCMIWDESKWQ
jgi:hypothetical protein